MSAAAGTAKSVWQTVVGQSHAVQQLQQLATQSVHAYIFVGPEGCGKEEAARAFSTLLITGSDDATTREAKLIARSAFSSLAYQGYGRMLDIDELKRFNNWAIAGHWPDLVVFIDVPLEQLLERLKKRELDRFEREDRAFFERIFTGFHAMAAADPTRWLIVDGTPPKDELAATILTQVCERLQITLS